MSRPLAPDRLPRFALLWADHKYHNYDPKDDLAGEVGWAIAVGSRPEKPKGWVT